MKVQIFFQFLFVITLAIFLRFSVFWPSLAWLWPTMDLIFHPTHTPMLLPTTPLLYTTPLSTMLLPIMLPTPILMRLLPTTPPPLLTTPPQFILLPITPPPLTILNPTTKNP